MQPESLKLFYEPKDRLRLTVGDEKSYVTVRPAWTAPLSRPNMYLALLDGKGAEITVVEDPSRLAAESRAAVEEELRRRYLTATVTRVVDARQEFGATYWEIDSDRGVRDFVTQNLQENAIWLSETHILLLDVDGNRFEIPNVSQLDARSRQFIDTIL